MALIGVSSDCSPSRRVLASSSEAATTIARLHQVRPRKFDTATATSTPVRTAPTRTRLIRSVPTVETWTTRRAVNGAVRSLVPGVTSRASR